MKSVKDRVSISVLVDVNGEADVEMMLMLMEVSAFSRADTAKDNVNIAPHVSAQGQVNVDVKCQS